MALAMATSTSTSTNKYCRRGRYRTTTGAPTTRKHRNTPAKHTRHYTLRLRSTHPINFGQTSKGAALVRACATLFSLSLLFFLVTLDVSMSGAQSADTVYNLVAYWHQKRGTRDVWRTSRTCTRRLNNGAFTRYEC